MWLCERASMLRYTHIACLVIYITTDSPRLILAGTALVRFKFVLPILDLLPLVGGGTFKDRLSGIVISSNGENMLNSILFHCIMQIQECRRSVKRGLTFYF
jgi:hypothetical protein